MELIDAVAPARHSAIVDVGGGSSFLVDRLLDRGYTDLIVADVSDEVLRVVRERLGGRAKEVTWLVADARHLRLPEKIDVWHDRAVFHFLTNESDRRAYVDSALSALRIGGHVVIATFGPEGPERCSGLPVERYDAARLAECFGRAFQLLQSVQTQHVTPAGASQQFTYAVLRRRE